MSTSDIRSLGDLEVDWSGEIEELPDDDAWNGRCSEERTVGQEQRERERTPSEMSISEFWDYVQKMALGIRSRGLQGSDQEGYR